MNRTIDYELSSFRELLALDIQGYQKNSTSTEFSEIFLKHNALLELVQLEYLNIQHVRLVPNPNSKNKEIPKEAYEYLQTIHSRQILNVSKIKQNITFVVPREPEILPYHEFKAQSTIVTTFSHLSNLRFLRLYQCKLAVITWEMFEGLRELKTLSLEGNEIAKIPEFAFYGMPNLKVLILSDNKLIDIQSDSLAGLFNLEHLDLSRNQLQHLSVVTFAPFLNLYSLDIRHNPITSIQEGTFEVTNMTKVLFVGNENNAMTLHRNAFNGLNELEKLLITGLNISNLENSLLTGMPKLKYLKLHGRIEYIPFDAFTSSKLLETLILKNCSLKSISMDAFYGLPHLRHLDLSDNQLQTLPTGIFDELELLDELILSYNQLTTLPSNIFGKLSNIKMIHLNENPWNCSCKLAHWPAHIVNRIKQTRIVEKCNYQYDKSPCLFEPEDYYAYSVNIVPKCATPKIYEDWNVLHVVHKRLNCDKPKKQKKFLIHSSIKQKQESPEINEKFTKTAQLSTNHEHDELLRIEDEKSTPFETEEKSRTLKKTNINKEMEMENTRTDDVDNSLMNLSSNVNIEKKLNEVRDL